MNYAGRPSPLDAQSYYRATASPYSSPAAARGRKPRRCGGDRRRPHRPVGGARARRPGLCGGGGGRGSARPWRIGPQWRPDLHRLCRRHGQARASARAARGRDLLCHCRGRQGADQARIAAYRIDCDLAQGQIIGAPKPAHLAALARERDELEIGMVTAKRPCSIQPRSMPRSAPPLYHGGLLDRGGGPSMRSIMSSVSGAPCSRPAVAFTSIRRSRRSSQDRAPCCAPLRARCRPIRWSSPVPISEGCCRRSRRISCRWQAM